MANETKANEMDVIKYAEPYCVRSCLAWSVLLTLSLPSFDVNTLNRPASRPNFSVVSAGFSFGSYCVAV